MIYLDENITLSQRQLLESWHFNVQQIGVEIKHKGIEDGQIITYLQQLNGATFITGDSDFFENNYCHPNYCIIYLEVVQNEIAFFVRKVLTHTGFNTQVKRLGKIIKASQTIVSYWQFKNKTLLHTVY